jgi:hypothetical protein
MSVATPSAAPYNRHPLGLPPGSVRAVLALMIAGLFWLVLAIDATRPELEIQVPLFLYFLTGMVLLFIGAHGHSIGGHLAAGSPLGLPRGSVRAILMLGTAGLFAWLYVKYPDRLTQMLKPTEKQLDQWPTLLLTTFGGYSIGYVIGRGPWRRMAAFQDLLAWVSLLAMIGLVIETIWVVFINPSLKQDIDLRIWEAILTAAVSFYFGARS